MSAEPPMIIKATFADIQPVKTRGVVKFIFEVPDDGADEALKLLGGMPRGKEARWCAIARIDMRTIDDQMNLVPEKERRAFCDLPYTQQAALKSKDVRFQLFMCGMHSEQNCAYEIRKHCGVDSRADILPGTTAGEKWLGLLREFEGIR